MQKNKIIKVDYLGMSGGEQVKGIISVTVDYNKWMDVYNRGLIMRDVFDRLQKELEKEQAIVYAVYIRYSDD